MKNLGTAHVRAKECPFRGKYKGKSFTFNQVYTWMGYLATSAKAKGLKEQYANLLIHVAAVGMRDYEPFEEDIDNE